MTPDEMQILRDEARASDPPFELSVTEESYNEAVSAVDDYEKGKIEFRSTVPGRAVSSAFWKYACAILNGLQDGTLIRKPE